MNVIVLALAAAVLPAAGAGVEQRVEKGGIALEFSLQPLQGAALEAGGQALFRLRVQDAGSGSPIPGLRPRAWIGPGEGAADDKACTAQIRSYTAGRLAGRPEVDLNSFYLVTLNHDRTITVIDPQIAFNRSKLEGIVALPGDAGDWAVGAVREEVLVSLPELSQVVLVSLARKKILHVFDFGPGAQPRRLARQGDGRRVWVALEGAGKLAVLDTVARKVAGEVAVEPGALEPVASADGRHVFAVNRDRRSVAVVDGRGVSLRRRFSLDFEPAAAAFGEAAGQLYVAGPASSRVLAFAPESAGEPQAVASGAGVTRLGFAPDGRHAYALDRAGGRALVIDSAQGRVINRIPVGAEPDELAFSANMAYVRGRRSERVSLIDLRQAARAGFAPVEVPIGQKAPAEETGWSPAGALAALTPEANAMVIANVPERTLHFYREGMMVPLGVLQNYKRVPRALMVLDQSLAETAPGEFSRVVALARGGDFAVPVYLDNPRLAHCFAFSAQGTQAPAAARPEVTLQAEDARPVAGQPIRLAVQVNGADGKPVAQLRDVSVLVTEAAGQWRRRLPARPVGEGRYEASVTLPASGLYKALVAIPSRRIDFTDLRPLALGVGPSTPAEAADTARKE